MPNPVQLVTGQGTLDLDATSGKKLEIILAKSRSEQLCRHWKSKLNEKCQKGEAEGRLEVQVKEDEEIDGDQIKKAAACLT